jgi:hypothetical protein
VVLFNFWQLKVTNHIYTAEWRLDRMMCLSEDCICKWAHKLYGSVQKLDDD